MCYDYTQIKVTFWMSLVTLCETTLFLEEEEKEGGGGCGGGRRRRRDAEGEK